MSCRLTNTQNGNSLIECLAAITFMAIALAAISNTVKAHFKIMSIVSKKNADIAQISATHELLLWNKNTTTKTNLTLSPQCHVNDKTLLTQCHALDGENMISFILR